MNKLVPTLVLSLLASFVLVWYLATKNPHSGPKRPKNSIIVGTNAEYSPFSFMENGTISGFDIDLINEVAKRLDKTLELQDMPFDALIPALQVGTIEMMAGGITPTAQRAKQVIFTKPYLTGDQLVIVSQAARPVENLEQLHDGKTMNIAVNEGYTADYYVTEYYKDKKNAPTIIRFSAPIEAFMAIDSQRVEGFIAAQNTVKPFIEHFGKDKYFVVPIESTSDEYALAISKKYPDLLKPIQNALDEIANDGTLDALKKKWKLA